MSQQKTTDKQLTVSQQKELEEWQEKLKNGEALKEAKKIVCNSEDFVISPEYKLRKVAKNIIPKFMIKNEKLTKEELEQLSQSAFDYGIENHTATMESIEERYRGMIFNLRRELVKEYNCQTYGEKALVDMAVSAYARNLSYTKRLINTIAMGHTNPGLNCFMSVMSKEIDRANRHFLTALETLKQFKQPELNFNIKTKNAFIAQNQNLINNQNKPDEIIEAK